MLTRALKFHMLFPGILLLLSACGESPTEPDMRGPNEIWFQNSQVVPSTLVVTAGTRVVWRNRTDESHGVDSGTFMNPTGQFALDNIAPNTSDSHVFSTAGTFKYYCSLHQTRQSEEGTIIVN